MNLKFGNTTEEIQNRPNFKSLQWELYVKAEVIHLYLTYKLTVQQLRTWGNDLNSPHIRVGPLIWRPVVPYGYSYKASYARTERQSARMSKITNDGLTRPGIGCFIAVPHVAPLGVKGLKTRRRS